MKLTRTAAAVATGVLTTGGAAVGIGTMSHADAATPTVQTQADAKVKHCGQGLKKLPEQLRSDLKEARKEPRGERAKAIKQVSRKALSGDYGDQAQNWAIRQIRQQAFLRGSFPEKLRTDLKAIHKLPADQRKAARQAIEKKVEAGDYGTQVQEQAAKRKAHKEACKAQRQERHSASKS